MLKKPGLFSILCLALLLAAPLPAPAQTKAAPPQSAAPSNLNRGLAAHKAIYDIKLLSSTSGSRIINIDGQMFFEWKMTCDAWLSDHRFNMYYEYADAEPMHITSDFSTFEDFNGKTLDFTSRRRRDSALYEELRGNATAAEDRPGAATYTIPENLGFELPPGTLFPMRHSVEIVRRAAKGEKFFTAPVFDGSDDKGPVEVNVFIGAEIKPDPAAKGPPGVDAGLLAVRSWKVRMAFFPLLEPEATPEYEMTMILHENGVISDMIIEYSDFTVSQKLVALEPLKDADCKQN